MDIVADVAESVDKIKISGEKAWNSLNILSTKAKDHFDKYLATKTKLWDFYQCLG